MSDIYDCIIIGGGPSGIAAAIYSARGKMKTILFEKGGFGGQISITDEIANYPGFYEPTEEGRHPKNLINKMIEQAKEFGAEIEHKEVVDVNFNDKIKEIKTSDGNIYKSKAVIIATGAQPRKLGCKGELEYAGKGVSYCATCDANFFEGMEVFCVGGGDTAVEEAMYLSKFARKVTLIVRKDYVRCADSIEEKAKANPKIEIKFRTELLEVKGEGLVESAVFLNNETGEQWEYKADEEDGTFGVFIFVGYVPLTKLFEGKVNMEDGYIITDEEMKTNIQGIFACGDLRPKMLKQVITATADGAIAAISVNKYIEANF